MIYEEFLAKKQSMSIVELAELLASYSDGLTEHSRYMFGKIRDELLLREIADRRSTPAKVTCGECKHRVVDKMLLTCSYDNFVCARHSMWIDESDQFGCIFGEKSGKEQV
jgi:hypothetical protein